MVSRRERLAICALAGFWAIGLFAGTASAAIGALTPLRIGVQAANKFRMLPMIPAFLLVYSATSLGKRSFMQSFLIVVGLSVIFALPDTLAPWPPILWSVPLYIVIGVIDCAKVWALVWLVREAVWSLQARKS